jgi:arginine deiminase
MPSLDNQTIQLILVAAVAVALLIQVIVLLAAFIAMRKAARAIGETVEELRDSVIPVIDTTRDLVQRIAPKIDAAADDLAALTHSLREQAVDVQKVADEIIGRARRQAVRVDKLFSNVLDAVDRAGSFMADSVAKPMRQFSALLASAKAVVESLRNAESASATRPSRPPVDNDPFI